MKTIILLVLLVWGNQLYAQSTVSGSISIPQMQSIRVDNIQSPNIDFTKLSDYHDGIEIKSYCKLTVKCNYAWKLKMQVNNTSNINGTIPSGIISVRLSGNGKYIPIDAFATTILICNNDNISNEYFLDLRIDPKLQFNTIQSLPLSLSYKLEHQ